MQVELLWVSGGHVLAVLCEVRDVAEERLESVLAPLRKTYAADLATGRYVLRVVGRKRLNARAAAGPK